MNRPLISLCMIVHNESVNLRSCLESVRETVDELIVVDTGSTDDTPEIARQYGARIVTEPWNDDFARARNAGLVLAKGDWIFFLDADEVLAPEDRGRLREIVLAADGEAILVQIHNDPGPGLGNAVIHPVVRLFRNRPEYRFEGRIHEQITPSICRARPDAAFVLSDIRIHHSGYRPEIVAAREKIARNLRLLQAELRDRPDQSFHWYNLGVEYLRMGHIANALECFREAHTRIDLDRTPWSHLLVKLEARCLHAVGNVDEALALCRDGIRRYPNYTDLYYWYGRFLLDAGQWEAGTRALRQAIALGPAPAAFHREEGTGTYLPCLALGAAAERLRVFDAAIDWYTAALRHHPGLVTALVRIVNLLRITEGEEAVMRFMQDRVAFPHPASAGRLAMLLRHLGCPRAAERVSPGLIPAFREDQPAETISTRLTHRMETADRYLEQLARRPGTSPERRQLITFARVVLSRARPEEGMDCVL